jgi:glycosyltransferase involved in cell wall biosynthesis
LKLVIHGHICAWTGYGRIVEQLGIALDRMGVEVAYWQQARDDWFQAPHPFVLERLLESEPDPDAFVLAIGGPFQALPWGRKVVKLTMWETTGLPLRAIPELNKSPLLIVPSAFCAATFAAQGVAPPIAIVPLGIDPSEHAESVPLPGSPVVFGSAGRVCHGGNRKGHAEVVDAFLAAFPDRDDVRLKIKVWPDDPYRSPSDPRIEVNRKSLTRAGLLDWYRSLSVYVTASRGEGWGLQTHEAMAAGRPVVAVPWSGTTEFWADDSGWPIAFDIADADGEVYRSFGRWAVPRSDALATALRTAADATTEQRAAMGRRARERALAFTWDCSAAELVDALNRHSIS